MGDRANIIIKQEKGSVFFYTHWRGNQLPGIVKAALARKERWDDEAYLARIIFCQLVEGSERDETGFGISTQIQDNEHAYLVVDIPAQRVYFKEPKGDDLWKNWHRLRDKAAKGWTFAEYIDSGPDSMSDVEVDK